MEDSQVLKELMREREELLKRLDAVDKAIFAFGGKVEETVIASPINKEPPTVTVLPVSEAPQTPAEAITPPPGSNYNKLMPWRNKIMLTLNDIKSGTVTDIVRALKKYEPQLSETDAIKSVTWFASSMYRSQLIGAQKVKKKNLYFLKEFPPDNTALQ